MAKRGRKAKTNYNTELYLNYADEAENQVENKSYDALYMRALSLGKIEAGLAYLAPELSENQKTVAYAGLAVRTARDLDQARKEFGDKSETVKTLEQILKFCKKNAGEHFKA